MSRGAIADGSPNVIAQSVVAGIAGHAWDGLWIEAWYSLAVAPWLKLTADAQVISPARGKQPTSLILAVRGNVAF